MGRERWGNAGEAAFLKKAPPQTSPGKHFDPRNVCQRWQVVLRTQSRVGSADSRLLPRAGSARIHLLPPVLSTNSGTINWSSRILRIRRIPCGLKVGTAGRQGRLPLAAAGSGDEFRNHKLEFPNSANPQDSLRIDRRRCRSAGPAPTCCRRFWRRPLAAIDRSGQGLRDLNTTARAAGTSPFRGGMGAS